MMKLGAEELYRRLGRLLENIPDFSGYVPLNNDQLQWLGRVQAVVKARGDVAAITYIDVTCQKMVSGATRSDAFKELLRLLHSEMASLELLVPSSNQGSFIPVASPFDAFAAISKLLQSATQEVLVVDPYLDETVLTEFGTVVPEGVSLRLLSDSTTSKSSLVPAATRWVGQHGTRRPLSVRLAPPRALHDRVIFIDQKGAYTLTQSLKDFAKRSPAEIVRADDTAALKLAAYEQIWSQANQVI